MITNDLQNRIHFGDRDAFLAIYEEYGRGVYAAALHALGKDDLARNAVKQAFLTLYQEILTGTEDFDIPVRIRELAEREIQILRLVCGEDCALDGKGGIDPECCSARGAFSAEEAHEIELPPLERARAFRHPRNALFVKKRKKRSQPRKRGLIAKALILIICLFLLWALAGVLMGLKYLPVVDLGYRWFIQSAVPFVSRLFEHIS